MRITKVIKLVRKSKVLTEKEKRELIGKGLIETIVNSYKGLCKLPFTIVGITFCLFGMLFAKLKELMELLEAPFSGIVQSIDNWKEISLTKGNTRDKLIKEIKGNTFKVVKPDVTNAFEKNKKL